MSGDWIKIDDGVYQNQIDFGGGNSAVIHDFQEGRFGIRFFEEGEETPDPEIDGITKEDYALFGLERFGNTTAGENGTITEPEYAVL